ncbi:uncharacterized protein F5147DRAFT_651592 [Suillus discolor]|uniref:Uncharacterized protein n=1 Tax=Suillus discolor TaxID=1912936 RepID=A0A9P7FAP8_9AGAM|nr:uncharacterized protein F5147DRAFT_651592 [Suillus discolor]KAG2110886.1 hypothetical protein F5147DRAFT_651592 [Suillus discolor]
MTSGTSTFCVASVGIIICGVDVFNYLDTERSRNVSLSQSASQDEKLVWRLLNKSGQVLTVIDIACLTGTDLAKHKGRDKASITESHLWNHIPDTVYESWNTQPIIAGSDSKNNGDSSELFSDIDSIRDDVNHNPELASSLMEMDLSDSGDIHTDYKGKAKQTHTAALSPDESPTNQRVAVKRLKSEMTTTISRLLPLESPPSLSQLSVPSAPAACTTFPELSYPVMIVSDLTGVNPRVRRPQPAPADYPYRSTQGSLGVRVIQGSCMGNGYHGVETRASHCAILQFSLGSTWHELVASLSFPRNAQLVCIPFPRFTMYMRARFPALERPIAPATRKHPSTVHQVPYASALHDSA